MFYIYTPQGRTFSGPLERLRKVEKTAQTPRFETPDDPVLEEQLAPETTDNFTVSASAIAQYQQMLRKHSAREAVYHAYQVMSHPVVTVQYDSTCGEAIRQFEHHNFQVFPVLNARGILIATLSRKKLCSALLAGSAIAKRSPISDALTATDMQVITADPVTAVRRIAHAMLAHQLDALPVVDETHQLVGIVSRTDVLKCVTSDPPLSLWC